MNRKNIILTIVTVALLIFLPAIGLIFMWIFAPWKTWVKAVVTPAAVALTIVGVATIYPGIFLKLFGLL